MATFYQKQDEYPYLEDLPDVIETMSEPLPKCLFFQKQDKYPYLEEIPNLIESMILPLPSGLFAQSLKVNDGYPYLDLPRLILNLTKPLPFSMQTPNKAKKTIHTITIPKNNSYTVYVKKRNK